MTTNFNVSVRIEGWQAQVCVVNTDTLKSVNAVAKAGFGMDENDFLNEVGYKICEAMKEAV